MSARFVALDAERVLAPGYVEWDVRGRIVALRRARGPVEDLAVLPGLVNAHAHLQIGALPSPERQFLPWVGAVMAARGPATATDLRRRASQSLRDLLDSGTTAVGEIDSTGHSPATLDRLPMAGRCYRELTGFHLQAAAARALVRERMPELTGRSMLPGLSPHAPYSVSPDLMRAAFRRTRHLAIHCAELPEEQLFLRTGTGPFADLLRKLGRLPANFRPPGVGAVRWLEQLGVLRATTLLVHCQELERGDPARIAAAGAAIAVCPGTIDYFGRTPPRVRSWLDKGIPVALGTDSLASNEGGLSMRNELARAAEMWPELSPAKLLAMATSSGGTALAGPFGGLRRGGRADLIAVPAKATWPVTLEAFVHNELPLRRVVLAGQARRLRARS